MSIVQKSAWRALAGTLLAGLLLAVLAGRFAAWRLWVGAALIGLSAFFSSLAFLRSPELAAERRKASAQARPAARLLTLLMQALLPGLLLVASLDTRFEWSAPLPLWLSLAAFIAALFGVWLTYRALSANRFFSSEVCLQGERGQVVIRSGPYAVVRHPGYAGALLFNLGLPLGLGSTAGFGLALAMLPLVWRRIASEEALLQKELDGYAAYRAEVRWRLLPWVW